ncbi:MAG: heme-binding protein [Gemmataceae bacterium]|nr:heme-binding protein [Gemmataceae bacterium]
MSSSMSPRRRSPLSVESLEDRAVPALVSSQNALTPPVLTEANVFRLLARAAVATASDDAIIAIVDRGGNLLGVLTEGGVSAALLADLDTKAFAIDGAIAKARTAAFFANDTVPLTSRTIQFISQTTITEREVKSNPNLTDPLERGPGFVAPIGVKGHFPPNVAFTPQVDLFAIEHSNRDSILHPGADHVKGTADDVPLPSRFNVNPAFIPAGKEIDPPLSYGEYILSAADRLSALNHYQSRGIATLPGGIPIYKHGTLVGGIGVFFPGDTGFASEENSKLSADFDPTRPDRTLEAEFIGLAAAGGSKAAGFPVGALGGIPALRGFTIPHGRIDLVGITLDVIGPGGDRGPANLVAFAKANFGIGLGTLAGASFQPVDSAGDPFKAGATVPSGFLVRPHAGAGIKAAEVRRIIRQAIQEAQRVRAQIRLPRDERTRMVFAVTDSTGEVLGLYRMPDATVFSIDVAVAKARNLAYYNDPAAIQPEDQLLPKGVAFTARTFRYVSHPRFPISVSGAPPGPFSILNDPGANRITGLQVGAIQPVAAHTSVLGFDAFNPGTNFRDPGIPENQNGVVFFPGSSGVYKKSILVGGFGVSGDGVDQDDVVTFFGIKGYSAPAAIRVDRFFISGIRPPYLKLPRNPER